MKVAVVQSASVSNLASGEKIVAENDVRSLKKCGIEATLFRYPEIIPLNLSRLQKSKLLINNIWSQSARRYIREAVLSTNPDIVHFHGINPFLSVSALKEAKLSGAKVVQTLHNSRWICLEGAFFRNNKYCEKCLVKNSFAGVIHGCNKGVIVSSFLHLANYVGLRSGKLFDYVDRFIAVSEYIRDQHIKGGFPSGKIVVRNSEVDSEMFGDLVRNGDERMDLVFVSRVSYAKGVQVLVSIAEKLENTIHVVGDGPELEGFKEICENRNWNHVTFWGQREHDFALKLMSEAFCVLVPSQCGEAFSLVAAEAMSVETPVIASDIGGLGQLIKTSGGGIAIPAENHNGFVDSVCRLVNDKKLAQTLGRTGKLYVESNLNSQISAQRLIDLYDSLLSETSNESVEGWH